jgi:hypothetical protein
MTLLVEVPHGRRDRLRNGQTRIQASIVTFMLSRRLRSLPLGRWAQRPSHPILACHRHLATPAAPPSPNDPFANGTNAYYAEEMYRHWRQDPNSVHVSWNVYFSGLDKGLPSSKAFSPPPNLLPPPADGAPALHSNGGAELDDHLKVDVLFNSFVLHIFTSVPIGPTARPCIPGSRTPCCRARSSGHSRYRLGRRPSS